MVDWHRCPQSSRKSEGSTVDNRPCCQGNTLNFLIIIVFCWKDWKPGSAATQWHQSWWQPTMDYVCCRWLRHKRVPSLNMLKVKTSVVRLAFSVGRSVVSFSQLWSVLNLLWAVTSCQLKLTWISQNWARQSLFSLAELCNCLVIGFTWNASIQKSFQTKKHEVLIKVLFII